MLSLSLHLSSQDYDLCENCYSTTTHEHPLEKLGFSIGGDDDQPSKQNTAEARNQLIKKRNEYLIHACSCRDSSCTKPFCIKMKQLLRHARDCRQRSTGKCTACNFFIRLCASHAHECKEAKCPVPVCANLKKKMRERRQRQIAGDNNLARRRINQMRTISSSPTNEDGSGGGGLGKPAPSPATPRTNVSSGKAINSPNPRTPGEGISSNQKPISANTIPPSPASVNANPATPFNVQSPYTPAANKSEMSAPAIPLQPTTHEQSHSIDVNLQNVFQALVNGNPQDSFKAREYLRKHTAMVPRIIEVLRSANKLSEATQLQQEFMRTQPQVTYTPPSHAPNHGSYHSPSMQGMVQRPGVSPQGSYPQNPYAMAGPHRTPSPSPMYPPQAGGVPSHLNPNRMISPQNQLMQHQYYGQPPYAGGGMPPGVHPSTNMVPPPQYHMRIRAQPQGYAQPMMNPNAAMARHIGGMRTAGHMMMNSGTRPISMTQYRPPMDPQMGGMQDPSMMGTHPYQYGHNTNTNNSIVVPPPNQSLEYHLTSRTFNNGNSS